jgi:hypothetical protein
MGAPRLSLLLLALAGLAATSAQTCQSALGAYSELVDITVTTGTGLPIWGSENGLRRNWRARATAIDQGDEVNVGRGCGALPRRPEPRLAGQPDGQTWMPRRHPPLQVNQAWLNQRCPVPLQVNQSWLNLDAHTGTHIDSPAHFVHAHDANNTVEKLPLDLFIGPALVAEVPPNTNVTAEVLAALGISPDVERLILLTDNTRKCAARLHATRLPSAAPRHAQRPAARLPPTSAPPPPSRRSAGASCSSARSTTATPLSRRTARAGWWSAQT